MNQNENPIPGGLLGVQESHSDQNSKGTKGRELPEAIVSLVIH